MCVLFDQTRVLCVLSLRLASCFPVVELLVLVFLLSQSDRLLFFLISYFIFIFSFISSWGLALCPLLAQAVPIQLPRPSYLLLFLLPIFVLAPKPAGLKVVLKMGQVKFGTASTGAPPPPSTPAPPPSTPGTSSPSSSFFPLVCRHLGFLSLPFSSDRLV